MTEPETIIAALATKALRNRRRPIRITFMATQAELDMLKAAAETPIFEGDISKLIRTILHEKLDPAEKQG